MEPKIAPSETTGASPNRAADRAEDRAQDARDRNWVPVVLAAAVVLAAVVVSLLVGGHARNSPDSQPAADDPYASSLQITNLAMSESSNLAGGKVTYLDGHIANQGNRTVTGILVQVTFRDYANKVAQTQKMPLTLIRMRDPYIDTEMVSAAPLKPGAQQDFRLNFDLVSPDWSGTLPEMRILHVDSK
jgi:uncharacterized protein DUF2393